MQKTVVLPRNYESVALRNAFGSSLLALQLTTFNLACSQSRRSHHGHSPLKHKHCKKTDVNKEALLCPPCNQDKTTDQPAQSLEKDKQNGKQTSATLPLRGGAGRKYKGLSRKLHERRASCRCRHTRANGRRVPSLLQNCDLPSETLIGAAQTQKRC